MLEVAVIGAGAAGLVASRHLLSHGLRPCIFEAAKCLGGAWTIPSSTTTTTMSLGSLLQERHVKVVDWPAYQKIDQYEMTHNKRHPDQPREKLTDQTKMLDIAFSQ